VCVISLVWIPLKVTFYFVLFGYDSQSNSQSVCCKCKLSILNNNQKASFIIMPQIMLYCFHFKKNNNKFTKMRVLSSLLHAVPNLFDWLSCVKHNGTLWHWKNVILKNVQLHATAPPTFLAALVSGSILFY